jgi:hypothetical protein
MKVRDIVIGDEYLLSTIRSSSQGCSSQFFQKFHDTKVMVLKKLINYKANNDVFVQVHDQVENNLVSFWCSAFDLSECYD